jgi:hypothetical protein
VIVPRRITATPDMAGRTCPYCRFPIKMGAPAVECGACRAIQHEECFVENGGCAIAGCDAGPTPTGQRIVIPGPEWSPPAPSVQPAPPSGGVPPPPSSQAPERRLRSLAPTIIVSGLALLVGGAAVALLVSGGNRSPGSGATKVGALSNTASSTANSGTASTAGPTTNSSTTTVSTPVPQTTASNVTGRDANGFNTGPGCSDNPNTLLPGCSDSPSTPNGDPESSCPSNGVIVDAQTTTCGLAENVFAGYTSDGVVSARSPKTGQSYSFSCQTAGPGTTRFTICHAQDGGTTLYMRWHKR